MLKVVIITQEEPFYIPKLIRYVIERSGKHYEIVASTCLMPHRKNKSLRHWLIERIRIYSNAELFIVAFLFFFCKFYKIVITKITGRNIYSVNDSFREYNIKSIPTKDINSNEYLEQIKSLDVDIIISVSSPQLFGAELLSIPKKYCLNAHGTLLPRHRGVFGSWWTLFLKDKEAGATIHTMESRLDAGEIVWQREFDVAKNDTQYSIAYKTKRMMAEGLVQILTICNDKKLDSIQPKYTSSYHKAPTREIGKEFHKQGMRIIKWKNVKNVLSHSY